VSVDSIVIASYDLSVLSRILYATWLRCKWIGSIGSALFLTFAALLFAF